MPCSGQLLRNLLIPASSTLKMEAADTSETLEPIDQSTQHDVTKDNLKMEAYSVQYCIHGCVKDKSIARWSW